MRQDPHIVRGNCRAFIGTDPNHTAKYGHLVRCGVKHRSRGEPYKIYLVPAEITREPAEPAAPVELLPADNSEEGIPSWSADSRQIAFGEVPPAFGMGTGKEAIHICDVATRNVTLLPGKRGVWTARWSPNGRYISALTTDSRQRLWLYDFVAKQWRDLGAENLDNPMWSHDSKYIYYDANGDPWDAGIVRVRIRDAKMELVTPFNGIRRADFTWSGLAPDGSPIVLRDAGIQEIYALDVKWR